MDENKLMQFIDRIIKCSDTFSARIRLEQLARTLEAQGLDASAVRKAAGSVPFVMQLSSSAPVTAELLEKAHRAQIQHDAEIAAQRGGRC